MNKMDADETIAECERIFAKYLDGQKLMSNARHLRGSAWLNFNRVLCERWSHDNVVLVGDAAATAHFSIGSGTKLAMEDAIALVQEVVGATDVEAGLVRYQKARTLEALKLQNAARNRMEWFENVARYAHLEPWQFAYSLLTGSQRIGHANLRLRDRAFVADVERELAVKAGVDSPRPPMFLPLRLKARVRLKHGGQIVEGRKDRPRGVVGVAEARDRLGVEAGQALIPTGGLLQFGVRDDVLKARKAVRRTRLDDLHHRLWPLFAVREDDLCGRAEARRLVPRKGGHRVRAGGHAA